jgi:putative nucleotidyltransferase with HDIG domain
LKEKIIKIREEIIEKAADISALPILPDIAMEIMSFIEDESISMNHLAKVISKDPSLSAGVLKIANSAFYGLRKKVGTLERALMLLGLREIKNIIFMMSVFKLFPKDGVLSFDKEDYLKHSVLTAQVSRIFSELLHVSFKSSPFLCGLLHDIGKIFLDQNFHNAYLKVLKEIKKENIDMFEAEKKILGIDHAEVGFMLSKAWNFPDDIREAIRDHHDVAKSKTDPTLTCIIHLSNLLTNARKIGLPGSSKEISIMNNISWEILRENKLRVQELDIEKLLFEIDDELSKSEEIIKFYSKRFFY